MPERRVVPDTSCLIALSTLSLLDLSDELYGDVAVPQAVIQEFGEPLPEWAKPVQGDPLVVAALRDSLGHGEAEVIAVAAQDTETLAVLDDKHARAVAQTMGVQITGTLGSCCGPSGRAGCRRYTTPSTLSSKRAFTCRRSSRRKPAS